MSKPKHHFAFEKPPEGYVFRAGLPPIPDHLCGGLRRYLGDGFQPGGFLTAVICNDLMRAVAKGGPEELQALFSVAGWLHNSANWESHGSPEKMKAWLERFKEEEEGVEP